MRRAAILAALVLAFLASPGISRGGRGGGFDDRGSHLGSVRYHAYYKPHPYRGPASPTDFQRRWRQDRFWFTDGRTWFVEDEGRYSKRQPPIGMIVATLPTGSSAHKFERKTYHEARGVWFRAVMSGGRTRYAVVAPPTGD